MLPGKFDSLPEIPSFLHDSLDMDPDDMDPDDWIDVPALGGSDSGLSMELAAATSSFIGFLSRPDKAMLDGKIYM